MDREIKFRGKRIDNGLWVHGSLVKMREGSFIIPSGSCIPTEPTYHGEGMGCGLEDRNITDRYEAMSYGWEEAVERTLELTPEFMQVDPKTVGQFTGLLDSKGKEIYEDDAVNSNTGSLGKIVFENSGWMIKEIGKHTGWCLTKPRIKNAKIEVIGDIHTTPDLTRKDR